MAIGLAGRASVRERFHAPHVSSAKSNRFTASCSSNRPLVSFGFLSPPPTRSLTRAALRVTLDGISSGFRPVQSHRTNESTRHFLPCRAWRCHWRSRRFAVLVAHTARLPSLQAASDTAGMKRADRVSCLAASRSPLATLSVWECSRRRTCGSGSCSIVASRSRRLPAWYGRRPVAGEAIDDQVDRADHRCIGAAVLRAAFALDWIAGRRLDGDAVLGRWHHQRYQPARQNGRHERGHHLECRRASCSRACSPKGRCHAGGDALSRHDAGCDHGFLVYNVHPASIFMGDTGGLFLGLNLAAHDARRRRRTARGARQASVRSWPGRCFCCCCRSLTRRW